VAGGVDGHFSRLEKIFKTFQEKMDTEKLQKIAEAIYRYTLNSILTQNNTMLIESVSYHAENEARILYDCCY